MGPPTPQLDAAWDKLLARMNMFDYYLNLTLDHSLTNISALGMVLNDEEAGNIKGTTYQEPDGSWLMT